MRPFTKRRDSRGLRPSGATSSEILSVVITCAPSLLISEEDDASGKKEGVRGEPDEKRGDANARRRRAKGEVEWDVSPG